MTLWGFYQDFLFLRSFYQARIGEFSKGFRGGGLLSWEGLFGEGMNKEQLQMKQMGSPVGD